MVPVKCRIPHSVHYESEKVLSDILVGAEWRAKHRIVKDDGTRATVGGACHHVQREQVLLPRMGKPSVRRLLPAYEKRLLLLRLRNYRLLQVVIKLLHMHKAQSGFQRRPHHSRPIVHSIVHVIFESDIRSNEFCEINMCTSTKTAW